MREPSPDEHKVEIEVPEEPDEPEGPEEHEGLEQRAASLLIESQSSSTENIVMCRITWKAASSFDKRRHVEEESRPERLRRREPCSMPSMW